MTNTVVIWVFVRRGIKVHEEIMMKASSSDFFVSWKPTKIDIKKLLSLIQSGAECQWEMHLED